MIRKNGKVISWLLTAALAVPVFGNLNLPVLAQSASEEKQYILVMKNEQIYDEVAEEIHSSITVKTPVLSENNVLVAELTEEEAASLDEQREVLIEEDIMISASTVQEEPDTRELTIEEARQKKTEIKQRKQELLQEDESPVPEAEYEWNLQAINLEEITPVEEQNQQKIKIAVLDSGVDYVSGINLAGYVNLVDEEQEIAPMFQDLTGHGTGIAGIIAGNGETGINGVNPNAELYSVKVLNEENNAPLSRIIRGIYWCIENDMDIINMSFGTSSYSQALEQAVQDAHKAGLLMIAAAGNQGGAVEYPAAFQEVMAVAAATPEAGISEFSSTGEELDVAAPGEKIRVTSFFNGSIVTHGTSISVPHVTGVASLLWEKDLTKSNEFIRRLINCSAKEIDGTDDCGLLDAGFALDIYDSFAESFDETELIPENIPENTQAPETFEDVNTDHTYVEGRWGGSDHQAAMNGGIAGFSAEAISILKKGIVYPDRSSWQKGKVNPRWHGFWAHYNENITAGKEINYIAVFEMVTEIALEGGDIKSYMTCDWFSGMDSTTYSNLKTDINELKTKYASLLPSNTKANRKYFLYGCGLHAMTDAFAHSTTRPNGQFINHWIENGTEPDSISYYPRRYKAAAKLAQYALQSLKEEIYSDGDEVVRALNSEYTEDATYKMINLKKYANANGYTGSVLGRATINQSSIDY